MRVLRGVLFGPVAFLALSVLSCSERRAKGPWEANGKTPSANSLTALPLAGDHGDIGVPFLLAPPDRRPRDVRLEYSGGCAAGDGWRAAKADGPTEGLTPGAHHLAWWSWDQEADCGAPVRLRLSTDAGEEVEWQVALANVGDNSGFYDSPRYAQGIGPEDEAGYQASVSALLGDPTVDFVTTRRGDGYEVRAARGSVWFRRVPTRDGYQYEVDSVYGLNPIERQDPTWFPTLADELAAGSNPNNISIPKQGYGAGDPRLSFIEPEDDSYPYAYERIAAYFDHPDSADFLINWKGYAHAIDSSQIGDHGSLDIVQSRSPLVFWGAGVRSGMSEALARHVDIAPTVAKLLGMPTTFGVDERGVWSHEVYLRWQDGHPLDDVLDGTVAQRVIVVVCDGLAFSELLDQANARWKSLPNFARLIGEGAWMGYGSITNYPSVTFPSHNTIGSGVYGGHHGLVDNLYYYRAKGKVADPIGKDVLTEKYFNPVGPAETLHMALHRATGSWVKATGEGAFTASLFDPSIKDADKSDLQFRDRSGQVPFPPSFKDIPPEIPRPDPSLRGDGSAYSEQLVEEIGMNELFELLTRNIDPRYVIINFPTTDGDGHVNGPHGDKMKLVLSHIDADLGVLFGWLETLGIDATTAIVLTSDHGMQLGDPSRSGWPLDTLDAAGIQRAADTGLGVYLLLPGQSAASSSDDGADPRHADLIP